MSIVRFFAQIIDNNQTGLPEAQANQDTLNTMFTIGYVVIGALSFLVLVIAGLRYILAQGDPQKITESKNQIMYALIGLVIAALAAVIVNFVLNEA